MSRIRTIKPRFMMSRDTAKLSLPARLFFLQLLTELDDEGRLNYSSKQLAGTLYPHDDDVDGSDIKKWVKECCAATMLIVYRRQGSTYLFAPAFRLHQKINKPQKSFLPDPFSEDCEIIEGSIPDDGPDDKGDGSPVATLPTTHPRIPGNKGMNSGKSDGKLPESPPVIPVKPRRDSATATGKASSNSGKTPPQFREGRGMEKEEEEEWKGRGVGETVIDALGSDGKRREIASLDAEGNGLSGDDRLRAISERLSREKQITLGESVAV